jgi:hypothetical protein
LHHLLFNDDGFASKVRSLLLPVPTTDTANIDEDDRMMKIYFFVHICSCSFFCS